MEVERLDMFFFFLSFFPCFLILLSRGPNASKTELSSVLFCPDFFRRVTHPLFATRYSLFTCPLAVRYPLSTLPIF